MQFSINDEGPKGNEITCLFSGETGKLGVALRTVMEIDGSVGAAILGAAADFCRARKINPIDYIWDGYKGPFDNDNPL